MQSFYVNMEKLNRFYCIKFNGKKYYQLIIMLNIQTLGNVNCINANSKIAAFDFDWTLVKPKDNRKYPKSPEDWQWLYPSVPFVLNKLSNDGFKIIIFTNQSKPWKQQMIETVMSEANIDACAIAWNKEYYKGSKNQLELFNAIVKSTIDKDNSIFVGDAIGRPDDFSDTDKIFAESVGLRCMSPEDIFVMNNSSECSKEIILDNNTVAVLVGCPGSGKSTLSVELEKQGAYVVHGDDHKSLKHMIKAAEKNYATTGNTKYVFDATNGKPNKRAEYIEFAKKHNIENIICIVMTTDIETAYARNRLREKPVPRIAYSVYKKHFVEPNMEEGFTKIINY